MGLKVTINGRERQLDQLKPTCGLPDLLAALELKSDRVAVELNGAICARTGWARTDISSGDRLEIVHFVGGGAFSRAI